MGQERKPYRIKHIKTGLYYQPSKSGNNLSTKGKVYFTNTNCIDYIAKKHGLCISLLESGGIYKKYHEALAVYFSHFNKVRWNKAAIYYIPCDELIKEEL